MTDDQSRAEEIVAQMTREDAFSRWLGLEILEIRPSFCKARMKVRTEMQNGFGVCHGGVHFSLADSVFAFASNSLGRVAMSIQNSMSYPNPVYPGDVIEAVAEERSMTKRLAVYDVTVTKSDGTVVGLFRGTAYRTEKEYP